MSSNLQVSPRNRPFNSHSSIEESEHDENSLMLRDIALPPELIEHILCYADERTVLNCRLLCKEWNDAIVNYVLRRKAEIKAGCAFPSDTYHLGWEYFYLICTKFNRNLIRNHSGEKGLRYWTVIRNLGDLWAVEKPPSNHGVPMLPADPDFGTEQRAFVTSYGVNRKQYTIDLIMEGFPEDVLDQMHLSIEISEWYSCRWDCSAEYELQVYLLNKPGEKIDEFSFEDILEGDRQSVWFRAQHEFKNCRGVRKIRFIHGGCDRQYWAGHYGSKMARACVKFKIPNSICKHKNKFEISFH